MNTWKSRLKACAIHFFISLIVAMLAAWLVFGYWYPIPYGDISGGYKLFIMLIGVDLIIGPLITLIVFNGNKNRRHLIFDFSVLGILQIAALFYGMWAVYTARPVYMVFEYHRMVVVHAVDIDSAALAQAPEGLQVMSLKGPNLLSLRPFKSADESYDSTILALAGTPQAAQPALWQPYEKARDEILKESKSVEQLKMRFPAQSNIIDQAVITIGRPPETLRILPLLVRQIGWTILIDSKTALPLGVVPLDSF